jgi:hypothetical protein
MDDAVRSSWGLLTAAATKGDLGTLVAVLLAIAVLACAGVTIWLLYRGLWLAGAVAALVTVLFAVFLL